MPLTDSIGLNRLFSLVYIIDLTFFFCLSGEVILVMRHFESGRRIHAYDISRKGRVLYTINLDESSLKLTKIPGYISIDIDGNFLCAADQDKIVIWNARNGKYIRTIAIPAHYDHR